MRGGEVIGERGGLLGKEGEMRGEGRKSESEGLGRMG